MNAIKAAAAAPTGQTSSEAVHQWLMATGRSAFTMEATEADISRIDLSTRDASEHRRRLNIMRDLGFIPIVVSQAWRGQGRRRKADIEWDRTPLLIHRDVDRDHSEEFAASLLPFNSRNYVLPRLFHLSAYHFWGQHWRDDFIDESGHAHFPIERLFSCARPLKEGLRYKHESLLDTLLRQRIGKKARAAGLSLTFDGDVPVSPPAMLVKKLVPLTGITFLGGQSGAGKTFAAVDLAVALASGMPFFGHAVEERVGTVILAGEGGGTLSSRVNAARLARGIEQSLPIAWAENISDLTDKAAMAATVDSLKQADRAFRGRDGVRLGLVIVDTLAASFSMKDENSNAEATAIIRALKELSGALSVAVMPVHHYGKGQETGLRGASAWRAGSDAVLSVLADRDQITGHVGNRRLALTKSRIGTEGWSAAFDLKFVPLGVDEEGEAIGSCHIVEGPRHGEGAEAVTVIKTKPLRGDAKAYLDAHRLIGICNYGAASIEHRA